MQKRAPAATRKTEEFRKKTPTPDATRASTAALSWNGIPLQTVARDVLHAPPEAVLALQRSHGNQMVQRLVSEQVQTAQTRTVDGAGGEVDSALQKEINAARGGGQPLDERMGTRLGRSLGADMRGVRVHTNAKADSLSRALSADAFTLGADMFFRNRKYNPASIGGQKLIAHEAAHVVQQGGVRAGRVQTKLQVGRAGDVYEREADLVAQQLPPPAQGLASATHAGTGASSEAQPEAHRGPAVASATKPAMRAAPPHFTNKGGLLATRALQRFYVRDVDNGEEKKFISQGEKVGKSGEEDVIDYAKQKSQSRSAVKIADDATVAVQETKQPKVFFATQERVEEFNRALDAAGSWYRLIGTANTIVVSDQSGALHKTLKQVIAMNLRTHTQGPSMITKQLCNFMAAEVSGAGITGKLKPKFKEGERSRALQPNTGERMANDIATQMAQALDKKKGVKPPKDEYSKAYVEQRLKEVKGEELETASTVASELGVNEYTPPPEIGDAYVTHSSGDYGAKGKWNYHWGGVVGKAGSDIITLENYARATELQDVQTTTGGHVNFSPESNKNQLTDTRYFFQMYGTQQIKQEGGETTTQDRSFHTEMVGTGDFLNPVTMLKGSTEKGEGKLPSLVGKVPIADEYLQLLKDSVGDWDIVNAQQKYRHWDRLQLIVSRVVDTYGRMAAGASETDRKKIELRRNEFVSRVTGAMPVLTSAQSSRFQRWKSAWANRNRKKMWEQMKVAVRVLEEYVEPARISG